MAESQFFVNNLFEVASTPLPFIDWPISHK